MLPNAFVRRLREHDWMAVGIELLIVMLGVFFALQVSNWNQEREDTARGVGHLRRITTDLDYEAWLLGEMLRFSRQVGAYGAVAMAHAESGELEAGQAWPTLLAYYQASQLWPFRQPATTFDEVRSSGELALLRDPALRARISGHYSESGGSRAMEVLGVLPKYREHVRGLTPWRVQQYIWANCYRMDGEPPREVQRLLDCPAPIPEEQARAIVEGFRRDPGLVGELRFWLASVGTQQVIMDSVRLDAGALAAATRVATGDAPRAAGAAP